MAVEHRDYPQSTGTVATACPFCGDEIDTQQSLAQHLRYNCEDRP